MTPDTNLAIAALRGIGTILNDTDLELTGLNVDDAGLVTLYVARPDQGDYNESTQEVIQFTLVELSSLVDIATVAYQRWDDALAARRALEQRIAKEAIAAEKRRAKRRAANRKTQREKRERAEFARLKAKYG